MPHPSVRNDTPFSFVPLFAMDEDGRPLVVPLARATYAIDPRSSVLRLAEEQVEPKLAGEFWHDGDESSYKFEPETAFCKPATDVVLVGHAHARNSGTTALDVGLKVGAVQKVVRVFGDRYWMKVGGRIVGTKPMPFERIPLVYERAFGGWDKADKDDRTWTFDPRNPIGRGFGDPLRYVEEGRVPLPNIEDPSRLIRRYGDAPPPAGFGFVSPSWAPRAQYAGTYDEAWERERSPLLPADFDRRFLNAASPGLIAPGYLRGDEEVVVVNAAPMSPLRFRLPAVPPPVCRIELRGGGNLTMETRLDTLVVDTDDLQVHLLWRAHARVPSGPHDVISIEVAIVQPAFASNA